MAKPRQHESQVPVLDRDAGTPEFSGDTTAANIDRERIAERAYQLYLSRGGNDGRDLDDWLEGSANWCRAALLWATGHRIRRPDVFLARAT